MTCIANIFITPVFNIAIKITIPIGILGLIYNFMYNIYKNKKRLKIGRISGSFKTLQEGSTLLKIKCKNISNNGYLPVSIQRFILKINHKYHLLKIAEVEKTITGNYKILAVNGEQLDKFSPVLLESQKEIFLTVEYEIDNFFKDEAIEIDGDSIKASLIIKIKPSPIWGMFRLCLTKSKTFTARRKLVFNNK